MNSRTNPERQMTKRVEGRAKYDAIQAVKDLTKKETPRDRQKHQRIQEILEVAVELFAKEGMSGFTMRRIASLAGITLSTLQHHFGNQRNLLFVTINSIGAHYMQALSALARDSALPPLKRFDKVVDRAIDWAADPILRCAYWELYILASKDAEITKLVDDINSIYYDLLAEIVAEINPRLSATRAKIIGVLVATQIEGLAVFNQFGSSTKLRTARVTSAMRAGWMHEIAQLGEGSNSA
jgi:AcrR family transcriptional regulator